MAEEQKQGRILKGIGGFYYIESEGTVYETRAAGRFRNEGITPLPGDYVCFTPPSLTDSGRLEEILERKNKLIRPAVANVDALIVVVSGGKPAPDLLLLDKLFLYAAYENIEFAIVMNKMDEAKPTCEQLQKTYEAAGVPVFLTSAKENRGVEELGNFLKGKCTCLAGQSAVGKSSLVNALEPSLALKTGGLSKKTERGRHTTRHAELLPLSRYDAVIVDTPGFSILETIELAQEDLKLYYPEFLEKNCRFLGCMHDKEPGCKVKESVEKNEIDKGRYERYLTILQEIREKEMRKYD